MDKATRTSRSRLARFCTGIAATIGLATAGALGVATSASADGLSSCSTSYVCVWEDANYETNGNFLGMVKLFQYIPSLVSHQYAGTTLTANDNVSSVYNKANFESAAFYKDAWAAGSYFIFAAGQKDGDLGNGSPAGSFNDTLTSIYYCTHTTNGC